jgi:putative transposase
VQGPFPPGARGQDVSLRRDQGCQPTARAFMEACRLLGIPQALTSDHNPKGHADTERVMRTIKEEGLWLQEWTCPFALVSALGSWITDDHEHDLHSSLGYKPPRPFEQAYSGSHSTPFVAA